MVLLSMIPYIVDFHNNFTGVHNIKLIGRYGLMCENGDCALVVDRITPQNLLRDSPARGEILQEFVVGYYIINNSSILVEYGIGQLKYFISVIDVKTGHQREEIELHSKEDSLKWIKNNLDRMGLKDFRGVIEFERINGSTAVQPN